MDGGMRVIESPASVAPAGIARPRRLRFGRHAVVVLIGAVLIVAAAGYGWSWWRVGRFLETTDDAYVGADVTTIAPHVAGFVAQILVADNQHVHAGQVLMRLDPSDFAAAVARAEAAVTEDNANLASLGAKHALQQALIRQAEADLAAKKAAAVFAAEDDVRYRSLARTNVASRQDAQRAVAATAAAQAGVTSANAALDAARQQLAVIETGIAGAKAAVAQGEADLRLAKLNLGYTEIKAPVDGYVADRSAQIGAYVSAGTNLLAIVPAQGLWVDANFKEDELARMRPGETATIVADVLPGRVFHGRVASLAPATGAVFSVIPAQNATGNFTKIVQRVPVRIAIEGSGAALGLLRPGLSTTVTIDTRTGQGDAR
jgi:membrane fusion protein, multidrug efflux system